MSGRDDIMASIRAHAPRLERPEPSIPLFDDAAPKNLLEAFGEALERMGGELLRPDANDPLAPVRDKISGAKVVCSQAPEGPGNKPLVPGMKPADLADVDYGIVRASFGVAETDSVCLTDRDLGVNTLGYLPQRLIVLDPSDIVIISTMRIAVRSGVRHTMRSFTPDHPRLPTLRAF